MAKKKTPKKTPVRKPVDKPRYVTSLAAIGREFDFAPETISRRWKDGGMPIEPDGRYDLVSIGVWVGARRGGKGESEENPLTGPSLRKKEVDVEIKEEELINRRRRNALAAGDYVQRASVDRLFANLFSFVRDELTRIPMELKASFPKNVRNDLVEQLRVRLNLVLTTIKRQSSKIEELHLKND